MDIFTLCILLTTHKTKYMLAFFAFVQLVIMMWNGYVHKPVGASLRADFSQPAEGMRGEDRPTISMLVSTCPWHHQIVSSTQNTRGTAGERTKNDIWILWIVGVHGQYISRLWTIAVQRQCFGGSIDGEFGAQKVGSQPILYEGVPQRGATSAVPSAQLCASAGYCSSSRGCCCCYACGCDHVHHVHTG